MYQIEKGADIEQNYQYMLEIIKTMLEGEKDVIANLSNISSVIHMYIDRLNWVGFYILRDGELVLGPFQGKPACIRIKMGRGVCGKAVTDRTIVLVENVHEFPGHIACDTNTNSEIVIPIYQNSEVYGVLDLDSPELARFTELERTYLEQVGALISTFLSGQAQAD